MLILHAVDFLRESVVGVGADGRDISDAWTDPHHQLSLSLALSLSLLEALSYLYLNVLTSW